MNHRLPSNIKSAIFLILGIAIGMATLATAQSGEVNACVANSNGSVRIVGSAADCRNNETHTVWSVAGQQGQPGQDGEDGLHCWDLNGNGVADAEEDQNDDGSFDALDCQPAQLCDLELRILEAQPAFDISPECLPVSENDAVYVSASTGDNSNSGLSPLQAVRTINQGLSIAQTEDRDRVLIQAGFYNEIVELRSGINLEGGYDNVWVLGDFHDPTHQVVMEGGLHSSGQYMTVRADGITSPTQISNLEIHGPDVPDSSPGLSTYGVYVVDSTDLALTHVTIVGGSGARGGPGMAGSAPPGSAVSGSAGQNAESFSVTCDDTSFGAGGAGGVSPASSGGQGGNGGTMDTDCDIFASDFTAQPGQDGTAGSGVAGGSGGLGGGLCLPGDGGSNGQPGNNGAGGVGGIPDGALNGDFWLVTGSGGSGSAGSSGSAGGGGGGSGGCDSGTDAHGAGGGGGGAGGVGAQPGTGGGAGGSSFGVFAVRSDVSVTDSEIIRGAGGRGGQGGSGSAGQPGGAGGSGGSGEGGAQAGGNGGAGGHGGGSGGGGGGAGGSAYGIYGFDSVLTVDVIYNSGLPGLGGAGGNTPGSGTGSPGQDGSVYELVED